MLNPVLKLIPTERLELLRAIGGKEVTVLYVSGRLGCSRQNANRVLSDLASRGLLIARQDPACMGKGGHRQVYKLVPFVLRTLVELGAISEEEAA